MIGSFDPTVCRSTSGDENDSLEYLLLLSILVGNAVTGAVHYTVLQR